MEIVNLIGYLDELDKISMRIVRQGSVHVVNALEEINNNNFSIITPNQNPDALMDLNFIKPYSRMEDSSHISDKLNELMDILSIKRKVRKEYLEGDFEYGNLFRDMNSIYEKVMDYLKELEDIKQELEKMRGLRSYLEPIRNINQNFGKLNGLNFFSFKIGKLSKECYDKLKTNMENISSIIYRLSSVQGYNIIISLTPKDMEAEVDRVFKSLNYEELAIPYDLGETPEQMVKKLDEKISGYEERIKGFEGHLSILKDEYGDFLEQSYSRLKLYDKIQRVNSEVACTKEFFYMAGWVPVSEKQKLKESLEELSDRVTLVFKPESEASSSTEPPTRLKNNWLVRPFEAIVRMYGTPSYNEMDPTSFVAVSYMIMFGSMFGDVGQGFIFLLAGMFLSGKMHRPNLGGILSRIGASSMVFGVLFGSVFGNEKILKPLLLHPMENINTILLGGVGIGIVFTTVGFIYSMINSVKRKDLEDGMFGKDGMAGLLFYWIIILTGLSVYLQGNGGVPVFPVIVLCILLGLMVLKQPVANLIRGHRPLYHEPVQDYYIESGFGMVETLLGMLSNTVSFIRVGAFALNHVGLFIAFETLSHMVGNRGGSIAVLILGNLIIIGLEGLIVFIQGLRLEYYELFNKYYEGDGIEYEPIRLGYAKKI